jgi:hypothetical protein
MRSAMEHRKLLSPTSPVPYSHYRAIAAAVIRHLTFNQDLIAEKSRPDAGRQGTTARAHAPATSRESKEAAAVQFPLATHNCFRRRRPPPPPPNNPPQPRERESRANFYV